MAKIFDNLYNKIKEVINSDYEDIENPNLDEISKSILSKYETAQKNNEKKNAMSNLNYGNDPEKMLDRNKNLGEQSEYVKKAIEPLFTEELAYEHYLRLNGSSYKDDANKYSLIKENNKNPNNVKDYILKNCNVEDLFNYLSDHDDYLILDAVKRLKKIGIEGECFNDKITVFDDNYLKCLDNELFIKETAPISEDNKISQTKIFEPDHQSEKFYWGNAYNLRNIKGLSNVNLTGSYLENYLWNKNDPSYFVVVPLNSNNSNIMFFRDTTDIMDYEAKVSVDSNLDIEAAEKIVEKTMEHFSDLENYKLSDIKEYIIQQLPAQTITIDQWPKTSQTSNRQLETAQKTGYVQGVCESVLAFNNDENRKIMTEATMTFLSKKLLSEMNVTKDMAQKFANPETYKALEKCVFTPKQEQQLEQTQSQGRRI